MIVKNYIIYNGDIQGDITIQNILLQYFYFNHFLYFIKAKK